MSIHNARPAHADALRDEIAQIRAELGETVQALAVKADVKARVRASATRTAGRVRRSARAAYRAPAPWLVLAAAAATLAAVLLARRRSR